jgi:hypothetical protein
MDMSAKIKEIISETISVTPVQQETVNVTKNGLTATVLKRTLAAWLDKGWKEVEAKAGKAGA